MRDSPHSAREPRGGNAGRPRFTLIQRFAAASLIAFLVLGFGLAYVLGRSVENTALSSARQTAYDTLRGRLIQSLNAQDMHVAMQGQRYAKFNRFINASVLTQRTVRVKVWNSVGEVIYSDDRRIVGKRFTPSDELASAFRGSTVADVSNLSGAENADDRARFGDRLLEVYIPIRFSNGGPIAGAFEIYQTYAPVASDIASLQRMVYMILAVGLFALYLVLYGIVRRGSHTIVRQQKQLTQYTKELEESYRQTIGSLAAAVESRDAPTELHSQRVTELSLALGHWLKLPDETMRDLENGALLHDVGKIGISDLILLKPGKLSEYERTQMMRHPEIGYWMLKNVSFLENALPLVLHHHEKWDGSGYPHGLKVENIPLAARLFAVIDAYDAITSDRPYRAGASHEVAMRELRTGAGTHFDPAMVAAFEQMMKQRPVLIVQYRTDGGAAAALG